MEISELQKKIAAGEGFHLEFKETLPTKESLAKIIVCFANTDGGLLLIGVHDSGEIRGIDNLDQVMRVVDDVAYHRCHPPVTVLQETVELEGKTVLLVRIPKGAQRPYRTGSGQYYVRSGSRCRQASREELLRLFQAGESLYFDETPVIQADYSDLDVEEFRSFLKTYLEISANEAEVQTYLKNLHLLDQQKRPTVARLLFFGKNPQRYLPTHKIIGAFIKGTDIAEPPFDRKDITGTIPRIIEQAQQFLHLYLVEKHTITGFESELKPELPGVALREAIVNAVAHRDYTVDAAIRILIFDNRVEIHTPGRLPNTVTIESIRIGGAHVVRNPTIYNLLYKMGLVTDLGSGVRRMIQAVQRHIGMDVELYETDAEFVVSLPRPPRETL
ncbi:MAG: transcriptional regulator [Calditrichaeota bacterium]|nr:MAG: transcriptional regulator [Calditrichota bacterium]